MGRRDLLGLALLAPLVACVPAGYWPQYAGPGDRSGGGGQSQALDGSPAAAPPPAEELATTGAASRLTHLTDDDQAIEDTPMLSPDGKWLLYTSAIPEWQDGAWTGAYAARRIMRSRPDGRGAIILTAEAGQAFAPSWMPSGGSYVAVSQAMGGADVVRALKVAPGSAVARILSEREVANVGSVVVSPDGDRIAFQSETAGRTMIGTARVNGSELTSLVPGTSPSWSPDGRTLAFQREVSGHQQLFLTDAESGSDLVQLGDGTDDAQHPAWSPDGRFIAFVSNRGWGRFASGTAAGSYNLFVMRSDGSGLVQLTEGNHWLTTPSWGSDGWIYFAASGGASVDLWRLKPDLAALR